MDPVAPRSAPSKPAWFDLLPASEAPAPVVPPKVAAEEARRVVSIRTRHELDAAIASDVRAGVNTRPLLRASPELRRDRALLLELVGQGVRLDPLAVDAQLLQDTAFVNAALDTYGSLDPHALVTRVANQPRDAASIASALLNEREDYASNRELIRLAVPYDPYVFEKADRSVLEDEAFARDMLRANYAIAEYLPVAWTQEADDITVIRRLAEMEPLVLRACSPEVKAALAARAPQVWRRYERQEQLLERFAITEIDRLGTPSERETILNERAHGTPDGRPLAVIIATRVDEAGAFAGPQLDAAFLRSHRVRYYEVAKDEEVIDALRDASRGQTIDGLYLVGHGAPNVTMLGGLAPLPGSAGGTADANALDTGDMKRFAAAGVPRMFSRDARILLMSCDTGAGRERAPNLANAIADLVPQAHVVAPTIAVQPASFRRLLEGKPFNEGEVFTYRVSRSARR